MDPAFARLRSPRSAQALLLLATLGLSACATPSAQHPLAGKVRPSSREASYAIYADSDWLYVRVAGADKAHRFQGSVTALRGALGALELDRPALAEQVASRGSSVQFDLEPANGREDGFRARLDHACLRFDLYVDGVRRPERVHLGRSGASPRQIPFERCP